MRRREFLKLGVVAGGTVLLGGTGRFGSPGDRSQRDP